MTIEKISTGVKQLDTMLKGGYRRGSTHTIVGNSGTGKSILAMMSLIDGCKLKEPGIYVSFEETEENIKNNFLELGIDLDKFIKAGLLKIHSIEIDQFGNFFKERSGILQRDINELKPKRLVIDSITAYLLSTSDEREKRKEMLQIMEKLSEFNLTTLMISEHAIDPSSPYMALTEEFLSDGIILLMDKNTGTKLERLLRVHKMRGINIDRSFYNYSIKDKVGIEIGKSRI